MIADPSLALVDQALARLQRDARLQGDDRETVVTRVLSVVTRPFSYVARVEAGSPAASRRVIVKIPRLKPGKADRRVPLLEQEIAAARTLASTLEGQSGLSVPDVVAFYPEIPALVWSEVNGTTLDAMAARLARGLPGRTALAALERVFHDTGRWLRTLQAATPAEGQELSLDDMIQYVDVRLQRISELGPVGLDSGWRAAIRQVFHGARLEPADRRLAAVHGDFSLSNVMYDGTRVVAIDFSRFGVGSIYYDVARIYHQIGLLQHKPWYLPGTIARLRRALLAGYDPGLRSDRPAFQLFLIQHLLCHWVGLLKASAGGSWRMRGFHRWVGYRHRLELDALVGRLRDDARRRGRATI